MSALEEFQFEILPTADAADGVVFGIHSDLSMDDGGFHPGSTEWASTSTASAANGATLFGRDRLLGPVWAWDLHVNRDDLENALETLSAHTTAWRWLDERDTPGAMTAIRYRLADRVRRVYGRPENHEASPNNLILSGYTPVTCDFSCVDGYTYDDALSALTLTLGVDASSGSGGLVFPVVLPANSLPSTEQAGQIEVGGDAPTYGVYRFNGPWIDPSVYTDDWTLSIPNYSIPAGQYVEIDTRPWVNTVMLNGSSSIGGLLGRRQKLPQAKLKPGPLEIKVGGYSPTGTATCQITWRNAHNSI
jgi:hypothetical protein